MARARRPRVNESARVSEATKRDGGTGPEGTRTESHEGTGTRQERSERDKPSDGSERGEAETSGASWQLERSDESEALSEASGKGDRDATGKGDGRTGKQRAKGQGNSKAAGRRARQRPNSKAKGESWRTEDRTTTVSVSVTQQWTDGVDGGDGGSGGDNGGNGCGRPVMSRGCDSMYDSSRKLLHF